MFDMILQYVTIKLQTFYELKIVGNNFNIEMSFISSRYFH